MGTRGSVGVIYQEEVKLGYNQFDSYPDGLGLETLELVSKINKEDGWDTLKKNISNLKNIKEKEIKDENIIEKYKIYSNLGVSEQKLSDPYCLFREIQGAGWIEEVYNGNLEHYPCDNNFIKDSLFCEYAYIINLDTMKLEFYDGFQKKSQKDNIFGDDPNEDGYYPCRLMGVFDLLNIIDSDHISKIVEKMNNIAKTGIDHSSVSAYFRKPKLDKINSK